MTSAVHHITWQKSSFSGNGPGNDCIEIGALGDTIRIRESDDPDAIITTHPERLAHFLRRIKGGEFDFS